VLEIEPVYAEMASSRHEPKKLGERAFYVISVGLQAFSSTFFFYVCHSRIANIE